MSPRRQRREDALMSVLRAAPHAPVRHTELRLVTNAHQLPNVGDKMQAEDSYYILQSLLERGPMQGWFPFRCLEPHLSRETTHKVEDS